MSWDLGDVVPLSIAITNENGQPEDAGQVMLTVTRPDGTIDTQGPIVSTTPGVYDVDYPAAQVGRHRWRMVATGANASAFGDVFEVVAADDGVFISLADARAHLKNSSAADEAKLRGIIAAACQMITDRMGAVAPVTVVHEVTACRGVAVLPTRPVISVSSVLRLPGLEPLLPGDDGWTLTSREGVLEGVLSTSRWRHRVRVTYLAGRSPIPANFRLAALELTAHLWRTTQHNSGGGRPGLVVDEQVIPGVSYALPYTVRQLLGLDKRPRDEILVG
ncbi:hypothetical protein [Sphaerisporangium sp. TRM90804]|uniref:hypothetical protein n=1 Tax=Sphaerisporangium sp. TRM90804 TaxID=3031113 RepID=UPI00244A62EB|nr:hypothetical protein [Sphaerisporangium sp. TRM90804]MDH2429320.1 hypothetical protein [Sphaerisporangium sp. TRM90804]